MSLFDEDLKILLLEDNHTDYMLTAKIFSSLQDTRDIQLDWAKSYEEGLDKIHEQAHDLYLIDYSLGAKNGLDLVEESHQQNVTDGPFVLLTDFDASALFERSVELGIYDHILKSELSPSIINRTLTYAIQRYRTEKALKKEKEFNSFILAEIPYLVISVDKYGLISSVNPAVTNLFGESEEELIGLSWKMLIDEDDREDLKYTVNDNGEVAFETRVSCKSGKKRYINWNILNRGASRGWMENTAFILSGKDITEQIKAEEAERRRQKMEALGQLAGGVAHEINNLLQPILMSSQMVASRAENDLKDVNQEYILKNMERIERNTKSAAKIVDDILLFSRGDTKETEKINIYKALTEAVVFVKEMLPSTVYVQMAVNKSPDKYIANIDRNELTQIITNMLINSSQAMSESGDVQVAADNVYLPVKEANRIKLSQGDYIKIDISDSGYGISEEDQANIFNPFFTTKDIGEGTGLGLSIVYKIIEKWNGTIKVKSKVGAGTTFSIYIPVF